MNKKIKKSHNRQKASILAIVIVAMVILFSLGTGLLAVAYGLRHQAILYTNRTIALFAAEAGYEHAIFKMSSQPDMLHAFNDPNFDPTGSLSFPNGSCDYTISLDSFIGSRAVYKIRSTGYCGVFSRTCEVLVLQEIGGWESTHRIPLGSSGTMAWPFGTGEVLNMPIQINKFNDDPDVRDIDIIGSPDFRRRVSIGEGRYAGSTDKYADVINLFDAGVTFDQPNSKINQKDVVQQKMDRFKDSTNSSFKFTPATSLPYKLPAQASSSEIIRANPAVQLEFFTESGIGKVRITNNCVVRGYRDPRSNIYDYKINSSSSGDNYVKYDIYSYHIKPTASSVTIPITNTYVTQSFGSVTSEPGGQIFVNGNVIIGGDDFLHNNDQLIKGKITVAATGNIWIADSTRVDGPRNGDMPASGNPNVLGLIAQGVIKVVDPGLADIDGTPVQPAGFTYEPIGQPDGSERRLPYEMTVEAAITVGGGGWGAEHVGDRKDSSFFGYDNLIVRGTITEAIRGIVGTANISFPNSSNGYQKHYHLDERLLEGILPGYIWLKGKFVPAPGGWKEYSSVN